MRDYLSNAVSQYGASMGRKGNVSMVSKTDKRFRLVRVRLDRGGYDAGGAYWGVGTPLYYYEHEDETELVYGHVRGATREKAKEQVRQQFPSAQFYR